MKRLWFDIEIGTSPDVATALLFALKNPEFEVVGVSISGSEKSQPARKEEALEVLEYAGQEKVPVYLGEEITAEIINQQNVEHTIVSGPLTNISRLVLDEANLGTLNIVGGAFSRVSLRGEYTSVEKNVGADKDSTRIVLTQYEDIVISSLDATVNLILDETNQKSIEKKHPFLKSRYEGYDEHLAEKYDVQYQRIILHSILPLCEIAKVAGIVKETVEFQIQADGSFLPTYPLMNIMEPIQKYEEIDSLLNKISERGKEKTPVPTVKHDVIRSVNTMKIFDELLKVL